MKSSWRQNADNNTHIDNIIRSPLRLLTPTKWRMRSRKPGWALSSWNVFSQHPSCRMLKEMLIWTSLLSGVDDLQGQTFQRWPVKPVTWRRKIRKYVQQNQSVKWAKVKKVVQQNSLVLVISRLPNRLHHCLQFSACFVTASRFRLFTAQNPKPCQSDMFIAKFCLNLSISYV